MAVGGEIKSIIINGESFAVQKAKITKRPSVLSRIKAWITRSDQPKKNLVVIELSDEGMEELKRTMNNPKEG